MDFSQTPNCRQILWRLMKHVLQLALSFVELPDLQERAAQRDARRKIFRMNLEPAPTDVHRVVVSAGAPILLRKLRKRNRRRILLNPTSQITNSGVIRHPAERVPTGGYGETTIVLKVLEIRPRSSTTPNTTIYLPAEA